MAIIVTPNLITITTSETATGFASYGGTVTDAANADADLNIQGNACIAWGIKNAGAFHLYFTSSALVNLQNQHLYIWAQTIAPKVVSAFKGLGISVMVARSAATPGIASTAYWSVDGNDTYPGGWQCYVVDMNRRPDRSGSAWTADSIASCSKFGMFFSCSLAGARAGNNFFIDAIRYGSGLTVYGGGGTTAAATWDDIYNADNLGTNKYGIITKRAGVYFLQGSIQIGATSSFTTSFSDNNQIVQFEPKYVSQSLYQLSITGSSTTCSFGSAIGTGTGSIGLNPIVVRGAPDFLRVDVSGSGQITQSLRPPFYIGPEVRELQLYGSQFSHLRDVNFGSETVPMNASQLQLVDNSFLDTYPVVKNFSNIPTVLLNNTIASTTGSTVFGPYPVPSASYAVFLGDTSSLDSDEMKVLNTYGFSSTHSAATQSFTLTNHNFSSNTKYVNVWENKTWNIVNPTWTTPTSNSLAFYKSASNAVYEQYRYTTQVNDSAGTALSGSSVFVYESTSTTGSVPYKYQANTSGIIFDITKSKYTPNTTAPAAGLPYNLVSQNYGGFAQKIYYYGYSPSVGALTVAAPINQSITLVTDTNITEPSQTTALALSSSIVVNRYSGSAALRVINYASGSVAMASGSTVTGSTSGATGFVIESLGSVSAGTVVLFKGNNTAFSQAERLISGSVSYATASVNASQGGFSGSYTWFVDANSSTLTNVYDYLAAEMTRWPITKTFDDVLSWGGSAQSQLMYVGATGYYTVNSQNAGVWLARRGTGTVQYMTSDRGNQYFPAAQYTLTLTGLIAGSEVRIYITGSDAYGEMGTELAGVESSGTTFSYAYTYNGDKYVDIVVHSLAYEYLRVQNILVTNANASIPVQQRLDRNYINPA